MPLPAKLVAPIDGTTSCIEGTHWICYSTYTHTVSIKPSPTRTYTQLRVASSTALKNQRMMLQYGIFLRAYTPSDTSLEMKRNKMKQNVTKYVLKWSETQRHDCQKCQTNVTLITISPNETERLWSRFFDAYCMCLRKSTTKTHYIYM